MYGKRVHECDRLVEVGKLVVFADLGARVVDSVTRNFEQQRFDLVRGESQVLQESRALT